MIDAGLKEQLLEALQSSVDYVNDGDGPNTAVSKAAAAADFNMEQTCRLCELYNTSRTIYHFENSPEEKTAEFELIDKEAVLKRTFGTTEKTAADRVDAPLLPDYTEYGGRELDARLGKLAIDLPDLPMSGRLDVPNIEAQSSRMLKVVRTQRKMADHAASEARAAREVATQQLRSLADRLSGSHWHVGTDKYARLIRCYDDKPEHAPVLAALKVHMPEYMAVTPAQLKKLGYVVDDQDLDEELIMIEEIKYALEGAAHIQALSETVTKEAEDAMSQFEAAIAPAINAPHADEFDAFITDTFKEGQTSTNTTVPDYPSLKHYFSGDEPGEAKVNKTKPSTAQALESATGAAKSVGIGVDSVIGQGEADFNKGIMGRLQNQQREVLLQDLLTNDPFIAEAEPGTVAAIYSQIMQIAPEVSMNKEVVRGILRQGLHNVTAVSPFDASSWAELEKTINEVRGTLPDKKRPAPRPGDKR